MIHALLTLLLAPPAVALTLEEKVGQLFMIAIDTEIAARHEKAIRSGRIGGAILRWDKFTGDEAAAFTKKMQEWAASSPGKTPFLIAVDHEGGPLFTQRLFGITVFPGNMALGAARSVALSRAAARASGRELKALGVHATFAPVLDVNTNPDNPIVGVRSFGSDPGLAARLGVAALSGYLDAGILPVVKHFPGHGDTTVDSHLGLPVSTKTLSRLEREDLAPFCAAVRAAAPALMPAHMVFSALSRDQRPVTLSSTVLQGFLREKWNYQGLIVSDSLDMGAIASIYGSSEAAVLAFQAGNDVLLMGKGDYAAAYDAVLAAVRSGRIPQKRLDAAVTRILAVKRKYVAWPPPPPNPSEGRRISRAIAARAVTVVRDKKRLLPLQLKPGQTLFAVLARGPKHPREAALFLEAIKRRHAATDAMDIANVNPSTTTIEEAAARAAASDIILVATYHSGGPPHPRQALLVSRLLETGKPLVQLSLMNPYDLRHSTAVGTALAAYGMTPDMLEATAQVLFGEIKPRGRLPVSIPGYAARSAGL